MDDLEVRQVNGITNNGRSLSKKACNRGLAYPRRGDMFVPTTASAPAFAHGELQPDPNVYAEVLIRYRRRARQHLCPFHDTLFTVIRMMEGFRPEGVIVTKCSIVGLKVLPYYPDGPLRGWRVYF